MNTLKKNKGDNRYADFYIILGAYAAVGLVCGLGILALWTCCRPTPVPISNDRSSGMESIRASSEGMKDKKVSFSGTVDVPLNLDFETHSGGGYVWVIDNKSDSLKIEE